MRQERGSVRKGRFHKGRWVEEIQRCVRPAMHHRASACGARTQAGAPRAGCCHVGVQDLFTAVSHTLRRLKLLHMAERTVAKYKPWLCALVKLNSLKGSVAFLSSFVRPSSELFVVAQCRHLETGSCPHTHFYSFPNSVQLGIWPPRNYPASPGFSQLANASVMCIPWKVSLKGGCVLFFLLPGMWRLWLELSMSLGP